MSQTLKDLLTLLNPKKIGEGLFRSQNENLGLRQVFGSQVVGQALYAAKETVPEERLVYSFHSYFLRPSDSRKPIIYDVEALCDGNSFSARRVATIQNGKPVSYMTASFQAPKADLERQKIIPSTPAPDGLPSETQTAQSLMHLLPPVLKDKFIRNRPLKVRPVKFRNPLKGHIAEPHHQVWICANDSVPDDLRIHQYLLGYVSDLNFLSVVLQPHDIGFLEPGIQIIAIDHSIWFYCSFNLDEWLLYSMESTSASSARGFVRGKFYTQGGALVVSAVQEGVMRNRN